MKTLTGADDEMGKAVVTMLKAHETYKQATKEVSDLIDENRLVGQREVHIGDRVCTLNELAYIDAAPKRIVRYISPGGDAIVTENMTLSGEPEYERFKMFYAGALWVLK